MSGFQGAGAPPVRSPSEKGGSGGGGGGGWPEFGFAEKRPDGSERRITNFFLKLGESGRRLLLLDHYGDQHRFAAMIHTFKGRDGKFNNMLASVHRTDPLGDPMNEVVSTEGPKEPSWVWALTAIDIDGRPNKNGKTYKNQRTLVLVTEKQRDQFLSMERLAKGFRGHIFKVSRPNDQKSFKIGTSWESIEQLSEEAMRTEFAGAAQSQNMTVDDFLKPFDYKTMFKPLPREKLVQIAADLGRSRKAEEQVTIPQADGSDLPF